MKKMFRALPNLFSYGLDMVKDKAKFYQENFNLSKEEISLLIKSMPGILSFSLDSALRKIEFFQEEFNFTKTELSFLLKKLPVILALSTDSVKQKAMQIKECKFTKDDILKIPTILTVPENNLKLRYIVLRQVATREEILAKKGSFMMNQEKAFARIAYLKNKYGKVNLNQIMRSEKAFVKVFKITSQEVMNKYKLTTEAVDQIQDKLYHEEIEPFNAIENAFIESEYGKTC